jgi:hypothetical protein
LIGSYFSGTSYNESNRVIDSRYRAAPIRFYCTDHKGENIRRILKRADDFIQANPLEPAQFRLAGGLIGVLAAANEELLKNDIMVNLLGFGTIFLVLVVTYRSVMAGIYMLIPLLVANAVVNAYMGARHRLRSLRGKPYDRRIPDWCVFTGRRPHGAGDLRQGYHLYGSHHDPGHFVLDVLPHPL